MKSSTGKYFIALDHVRAFAAFIVFTWHFIHVNNGQLAPPPIFPLSLLTEGHTGVALFMALSGYLFAKLLDGKRIVYTHFILNRFLRLAPLLAAVIFIIGLKELLVGHNIIAYAKNIVFGVIMPYFPNGGWSITVEFHFYLVLPILLFLSRKWNYSLLLVIFLSIAVRFILHQDFGEIQKLSYFTIVGRIDQFVFGMLAYQFKRYVSRKHLLLFFSFLLFSGFYWYFDYQGGFYKNPSYPSPSIIWVFMPTIEGLFYASFISWYDNSFKHSTGKLSRFIALIGTYSYSIYLLHFFVVFRMANFVNDHIIDISNKYLSILFSIPSFLLIIPVCYLSYRFIESPFLLFRTKYIEKISSEDSTK
ncbi:acyltransferase family protein [Candidatus Electronema sp. JM]|uniref:acyltransferase family protein n=1 Tax=Candidatus Electronema sp. JM TaxID=3401571 RepID=UPI003AA8168C